MVSDRKSIILYFDSYEAVKDLSLELKGELLDCVFMYAMSGEIPECSAIVKVAFNFIKSKMDADNDKYEKVVEKNKANGLKGGRPKIQKTEGLNNEENKTQKTHRFISKPKKADTDTDTDTDIKEKNIINNIPKEKPKSETLKDKSFKKPTLEEIKAYCLERNNQVNPEKFLDYHTANGWKVGKNPMKDWKATIRTWEKNEASFKKQYPRGQPPKNKLTEQINSNYAECMKFLNSEEGVSDEQKQFY